VKISIVKQSNFASNKHSLVPVPAQGEYGKLTCCDTVVARRKTFSTFKLKIHNIFYIY